MLPIWLRCSLPRQTSEISHVGHCHHNGNCRFYHENPDLLPAQFKHPTDVYKAPPPHLRDDKEAGTIKQADGTVAPKPRKAAPQEHLLCHPPGFEPKAKARGPADL